MTGHARMRAGTIASHGSRGVRIATFGIRA